MMALAVAPARMLPYLFADDYDAALPPPAGVALPLARLMSYAEFFMTWTYTASGYGGCCVCDVWVYRLERGVDSRTLHDTSRDCHRVLRYAAELAVPVYESGVFVVSGALCTQTSSNRLPDFSLTLSLPPPPKFACFATSHL